jgi:hypothetical protein
MMPIEPASMGPIGIFTAAVHRIADPEENRIARLAHPASEGPFATQTSFRLMNSWIPKSQSSLP